MEKQTKLATKLTIRISILLLLVFIFMISSIVVYTRSDLIKRELEKLELLAIQNAKIASEFMNTMINKQEVIISGIKPIITKLNIEDRINYMENFIDEVGYAEDSILSLFYVAEPNVFIPNTPNGFSIFATANGIKSQNNMFTYVDETSYNKCKELKSLFIVDPFNKTIDEKQYIVMTVLIPILDEKNNVMGMIGSNIDSVVLNSAEYNTGGFESFQNEIICGHETVITHSSRLEVIGKKFVDITTSLNPEKILNAAESGESVTFLDNSKDGNLNYRVFIPFYVGNSQTPWLSGTSISKEEFDAQIINEIILMLIVSSIGFLILVLFCYFSIRNILKPLDELENVAYQISLGNLNIKVSHFSNDELGSLSKSFNECISTLSSYICDIDRAMGEMSNGNFDIKASKPFIGDFVGIEKSIDKFVQNISDALSRINTISNHVSDSSDEISTVSLSLSERAEEQANIVNELSTSINDIYLKIKLDLDNSDIANKEALYAKLQLEQINIRMQEMMIAMETISKSSIQIENITNTIKDISSQTNVLALNASIEAMRAGEAGKGFAVVANKVRELAAKSNDASQTTSEIIAKSLTSITKGVEIVSETAKSINSLVENVDIVVDKMNQISSSCAEQSEAIKYISEGANEISKVVQSNCGTAQETASSSEELSNQAYVMKELVSKFNLKK